ncbi:acyl carrier protein phosphodiesterase [Chitinophaga arvensicola]|uniref:Acyl carrier protein phosphodiesterase n=1 Tax=Chitinophaga arvensicola TaxID=29529 RepID=A0A1I0PWU6_9BACT|nr:ACP phosphodiesterase [Chitinophaga arvensicola]SEW18877.1 Acyl carrier protein phosphodiesterase [Chitinophaga arvensicola]
MNHLAHAYLSFRQPELITGNLIADFVKGRKNMELYSAGIQRGIRIHRAIDNFTDQHPVTGKAKLFFRPSCGLYSGVFTDLVYDHFLANDTARFTNDTLYSFAHYVYSQINERAAGLPPAFLEMFGYMQTYNWLYNYHTTDGISRSIRGVARRAKYLETDGNVVFAVFMEHYAALKTCYQEFFPELQTYVEGLLQMENR